MHAQLKQYQKRVRKLQTYNMIVTMAITGLNELVSRGGAGRSHL